MTTATLNIRVQPRRMVTEKDAAEYCGLPAKMFRHVSPVTPIEMPGGRKLFDLRDLDVWLDGLKDGQLSDDDSIVARLN